MAPRGRSPGFTMGNEHRLKIQNSNILSCLIDHACGKRRMEASAVTAALGLLKKIMPDLASVEQTGEQQKPVVIVTGVPRPWDKPIGDTQSLSPNANDSNGLDTNTPSDSDGSVH